MGRQTAIILTAVFVILAWAGFVRADLTDGLISYWAFDDGSGALAEDSAGSNDGTVSGAVWTTGLIGGALDFDGVDDYVAIGPGVLPVGEKSLFAWVKLPPVGQGSGNNYDFFIYNGLPSDDKGIVLYFNDGVNLRWAKTVSWDFDVAYTVALDDDKWHFVGVTYDGSIHRLYFDGYEAASSPGSDITAITLDEGIGGSESDTINRSFYGKIDEVRIYSRALSTEEVLVVCN